MSEGFLGDAFRQPRTELELTLDDQSGTEHVRKALRVALIRLAHAAEEDPELDETARRQLVAAVDLVRSAVVGTLAAVRAPAVPPPRRPPPRRSPFRFPLPFGDDEEDRRREDERQEELRRPRRPVVHAATLLEQVQGALEAADRLLAYAEPPPPVQVPIAWHEDAELVNLIRDLMTAHSESDGELALRRIDRLRKDLALHHGITVIDFDGTNEQLFTLGGHPDPPDSRYHTVQPALMTTDGRILRRGEATAPLAVPEAPQTGGGPGRLPAPAEEAGNSNDEPPGRGGGTETNGGKENEHG
ncbi:hypothetical protein [Streptomyces sp. NPDC001137]|uniref:hypothetical protein n=1 Tax=Streptomyces sp. NPDC001137 TaxID=3154378 RepID=UPI0033189F14